MMDVTQLVADQCSVIAVLMAEIADAKRVAVLELGDDDAGAASVSDCMRQMAHRISEIERDVRLMEQQADEWQEKYEKLEKEYDDLVEHHAAEQDEALESAIDAAENLCVALGYARRPVGLTGFRELDELIAALGL